MKILIAASEAVPFCKTGGLADVTGALARLFAAAGHDVALFLPKYKAVDAAPFPATRVPGSYLVPIGDHTETAVLYETKWNGVRVFLIEHPMYYGRADLYRTADGDFPDNDERFVFYCRAVLEGAKFVDFKPDVLHCHDWQASLIPTYLETLYRTDGFYSRSGTLLTVHNIAYQGQFTKDTLFLAGFGWADFTAERLEYYGGFNFLKAGLVFADRVNTVSPTYAKETTETADFGRGMEGILRHRGTDYTGILNGIDTDYWNPGTDTFLKTPFGANDLEDGKAANAEFLRSSTNLPVDGTPLIGMVTRLDPQKGVDLALEVLPEYLKAGKIQLALLGNGDRDLTEACAALPAEYPGKVHVSSAFDEGLAHRIYGGADFFLMPSRFEPCGLSQMIAMRYGTLPIVVKTGGLADTVDAASGFVAPAATAADVKAALDAALAAFAKKEAFKKMRRAVFARDFSWDHSVQAYIAVFESLLKELRG